MEFLIHFIFQLVKISILGGVYLLTLVILARFARLSDNKYFKNLRSSNDSKLFTWFIICLVLFIWQFTYWGDHGLGDYSRIPIGYGREIEQINYQGMYIRPSGHEDETLGIENYSIDQVYCFGMISKNDEYFIWNLSTNSIQKFPNHIEYIEVVVKKNLDSNNMFHNFDEGYRSFWGGWRFWLLP